MMKKLYFVLNAIVIISLIVEGFCGKWNIDALLGWCFAFSLMVDMHLYKKKLGLR